jgi:hypothetical protein
MSAYPVPDRTPWSCSCRTISLPENLSDITHRCDRCGSAFVPATSAPPVVLVNPEIGERPARPPKNPPRARQHGSIPDVDLREMVYRAGLRGCALRVAFALYDHRAPGSWTATISREKLAESLGIGLRSVYRAFDELHQKGLILSQIKRPKVGGGFFLEYRLRPSFPEGGRAAERPRMAEMKPATRGARVKQPDAVAAPPRTARRSWATEDDRCSTCEGTGMEIVLGKGARRCPSCRPAPTGTVPKSSTMSSGTVPK